MDTSVVIKGYKNGIILQLNNELPFAELRKRIRSKFLDSAKFLGSAKMALTFDGRELSGDEQKEILRIISETTELEVICVFDNNQDNEALLKMALDNMISCLSNQTAQIFSGVVQRGKKLESGTSIVVYGNVEEGATVISGGSVVVLGTLAGKVIAGTNNTEDAFVFASRFEPAHLQIGDVVYEEEELTKKELKKKLKFEKKEHLENAAKIARLTDGIVHVEIIQDDTFAMASELSEVLS